MPHATLKLIPGVDTTKTPTLNEMAISTTSLVRFFPDRSGYGLVQKLGGWKSFVSGAFDQPIRALKAWSDLEYTKYLAIGGEGNVGVNVYNDSDSSVNDVTPYYFVQNGSGSSFSTSSGSSSVTFSTANVPSSASYVFFPTIVNVGNVNLTGPYDILTTGSGFLTFDVPELLTPISKIVAVTSGSDRTVTITFGYKHSFFRGQNIYVSGVNNASFDGSFTIGSSSTSVTEYTISYTQTGVTTDEKSTGGYVNARVSTGGSNPYFTTTSGDTSVQVTLINHGLSVGDTFNIPIKTTVGGLTLKGLYTVNEVLAPSVGNYSSVFKISGDRDASSSASAYENSNNKYAYYFIGLVTEDQGGNFFYGTGVYNEGVYGSGFVPVGITGNPLVSPDWVFDNWGSILVCAPSGGAIYYWQPVGGPVKNLNYIPNSPVYNEGLFVAMPQRQIIAYGSSFGTVQDPLLVRWCDLEDFTTWIAQANNQAGSYRIPTGSKIVGGIQAPQQGLIWTDLDLWAMTYIGQPYIYGFNKIGANAGLIAKKASGQMGGVVYWMGKSQFFKFSGSGVEVIPCPVWDQVFQNLFPGVDANGNLATDKIRCATNTQFGEVTWYFPAHYLRGLDPSIETDLGSAYLGTGDVNAYVKYNVALNQWDYGYQEPNNASVLVGRTAWIDQSVLGPPIGAATTRSVNAGSGQYSNKYFTAASKYASGESGVETIYFTPYTETFNVGAIVTASGFTNSDFDGDFVVSSSSVGIKSTVTITNASPAVVTWTDHNLSVNDLVYFTSSGTLPSPISSGDIYFVKQVLTSSTFTISSSIGGSAINTTTNGDGLFSGYKPSSVSFPNALFSSSSATDTSSGVVQYKLSNFIYQHEVSNNADGSAIISGFSTGYASIADGDRMTFIDQVWPDMKWGQVDQEKNADVEITFYVTNYPGDTPIVHGPYSVNRSTEYLSVRMRGRLISISVSSSDKNSFWRIGAIRYRFQEDGKY